VRFLRSGKLDFGVLLAALASQIVLALNYEPILLGGGAFLELSCNAEAPLRRRLICPVSSELSLRYFGNDTAELVFSALRHHTDLNIEDYEQVMAENSVFLMPRDNYLLAYFMSQGYRARPLDPASPVLYEVTSPNTE